MSVLLKIIGTYSIGVGFLIELIPIVLKGVGSIFFYRAEVGKGSYVLVLNEPAPIRPVLMMVLVVVFGRL